MLFVSFVVPFFSEAFATASKEGVAKAPKRMEPQRHEDTKSLPGWLKLRPAGKKVFLCAFVSLWFKAFMLFATASKEVVAEQSGQAATTRSRNAELTALMDVEVEG